MGYYFHDEIGASIAKNKKRVICIDGDGSFQINMQELQTVVNENFQLKSLFLIMEDMELLNNFKVYT